MDSYLSCISCMPGEKYCTCASNEYVWCHSGRRNALILLIPSTMTRGMYNWTHCKLEYIHIITPVHPTPRSLMDVNVHYVVSFIHNIQRAERCTQTVILCPRNAFCYDSFAYVSPIVLQALTNRRFPSSVITATQSSVHVGVHEIGVTGDVTFQRRQRAAPWGSAVTDLGLFTQGIWSDKMKTGCIWFSSENTGNLN